LLDRAWEALAGLERQTRQPYHTALRLRVDRYDVEFPSARLAEELGGRLGRPFTAAGARKLLQRARRHFLHCLLDEVTHSLTDRSPAGLERELRDLGLLAYCRPALGGPLLGPDTSSSRPTSPPHSGAVHERGR
jgi:hypothetical protein